MLKIRYNFSILLCPILLSFQTFFASQTDQPFFETYSYLEQIKIFNKKIKELKEANRDFTYISIGKDEMISPLLWSINTKDFIYMLSLLKQGADPDLYFPNGMTPLTILIEQRCNYHLLLPYANVNLPSSSKNILLPCYTPLMFAIFAYSKTAHFTSDYNKNVIIKLLKHGANPYIQNNQKEDAFDIARKYIKNKEQLQEIVNLLREESSYFKNILLVLLKRGLPRELCEYMIKSGYMNGQIQKNNKELSTI